MQSHEDTILAHGGATSSLDMVVGLAPVLLGIVLLGAFALLLAADRSRRPKAKEGYRDLTPTSGRLFFSGAYYEMEELFGQELKVRRNVPDRTSSAEPVP
jgi:hypothetical protein